MKILYIPRTVQLSSTKEAAENPESDCLQWRGTCNNPFFLAELATVSMILLYAFSTNLSVLLSVAPRSAHWLSRSRVVCGLQCAFDASFELPSPVASSSKFCFLASLDWRSLLFSLNVYTQYCHCRYVPASYLFVTIQDSSTSLGVPQSGRIFAQTPIRTRRGHKRWCIEARGRRGKCYGLYMFVST